MDPLSEAAWHTGDMTGYIDSARVLEIVVLAQWLREAEKCLLNMPRYESLEPALAYVVKRTL